MALMGEEAFQGGQSSAGFPRPPLEVLLGDDAHTPPGRGRRLPVALAVVLLVGVLLGAWALLNPGTTPDSWSGTPVRLTSAGGLELDPAFSPDGRFLAYSSDKSGHFELWLQEFAHRSPPPAHRQRRRTLRTRLLSRRGRPGLPFRGPRRYLAPDAPHRRLPPGCTAAAQHLRFASHLRSRRPEHRLSIGEFPPTLRHNSARPRPFHAVARRSRGGRSTAAHPPRLPRRGPCHPRLLTGRPAPGVLHLALRPLGNLDPRPGER